MKRVTLVALVLLGFSIPLFAQETGNIVGIVHDPSGAAIPGVTVTLTTSATQFHRIVTTNERGQYVASSMPIGNYILTAERTGFQKLERSGVTLTTASTLNVDLTLSVGSDTQTVSVTAAASLLQSQRCCLLPSG